MLGIIVACGVAGALGQVPARDAAPAPAAFLGGEANVAVTADVGVWVPRLTGTAQVGAGGTSFALNTDLAVGGGSAGAAGEFAVAVGRWRFGGLGFSVSESGSDSAPVAGTFGSVAIAAGDPISGSYSAWMAGAEVGYEICRPLADEPWPWDPAGANRAEATAMMGANGRPLFDVRLLVLGGALAFHYEQSLTNEATGLSSGFDRTVAAPYGGAGLDVRIGFDGRVPLVQDLRIYCNAGVGPSIPDAEVMWMVRAGLAVMFDANIGAEFGYRLFDFDLVDGPSRVDGGLRGLFGAVSIRF
jgi:hypothetical protein